jgi:Ca2+-transporting ATPase
MVDILHELPGRARFRVRELRGGKRTAEHLVHGLKECDGIRHAVASTTTASVLVTFSGRRSAQEVGALIDRVLVDIASGAPDGTACTIDSEGRHTAIRARKWHLLPHEQVAGHFGASAEQGIAEDEIPGRRAAYGRNRLPAAAGRNVPAILTGQLTCLPVALTGAAALLALASGGMAEAALLIGIALLNAAIGTVAEASAEHTLNMVRESVDLRARVVRDGCVHDIPFDHVVPGDVLDLQAGSRVAADARLVHAQRLSVDEAALTGESIPVAKRLDPMTDASLPISARWNMVYRGTLVVDGSGRAVVTATGADTVLGRLQDFLGTLVPPEAQVAREVQGVMRRLLKMGLAAAALFTGVALWRGIGAMATLRGGFALLASAIPSGLSTLTVSAFALGQRDLRRNHVLVRRLRALGNLAATQVVCFDKTGTLTLNRMTVAEIRLPSGAVLLPGTNSETGEPAESIRSHVDARWLLHLVCLCNEAHLHHGSDPSLEGSSTERALIRMAERAGLDVAATRADHPALNLRRRTGRHAFMETLHRWDGQSRLRVIKGSPTEVLELCGYCHAEGGLHPLDARRRERIEAQNFQMAGSGLRVLGVAYRWEAAEASTADSDAEDAAWAWSGLVGLKDPVRKNARTVVRELHRAGIRTAVITGDQSLTAHRIGEELGLSGHESLRILDALDLQNLRGEGLRTVVTRTHVFARLSPAQKLQVIQAYQNAGLSVVMVGDGFNDVLAMKVADVSIAMGRRGAELAKRTADLVIEDDDLTHILQAIANGRAFYGNIRRGLRFVMAGAHMDVAGDLAAHSSRLSAPGPLQSVWSNLACLGLALEPAGTDRLSRPPEDVEAFLLSEADVRQTTVDALRAAAAAGLAGALEASGGGQGAFGRSLGVNQLLYAAACRSRDGLTRPPSRLLQAATVLAFGGALGATFMTRNPATWILQALAIASGAWLSRLWTRRSPQTEPSVPHHTLVPEIPSRAERRRFPEF